MSEKRTKTKVKLPFAIIPNQEQGEQQQAYNLARPKPAQYADQLFPPPRGTRRSMGKR